MYVLDLHTWIEIGMIFMLPELSGEKERPRSEGEREIAIQKGRFNDGSTTS